MAIRKFAQVRYHEPPQTASYLFVGNDELAHQQIHLEKNMVNAASITARGTAALDLERMGIWFTELPS